MLNHNQFLLSIVSYSFYLPTTKGGREERPWERGCLFVKFAEVLILKGKADAYKELICIVERVHFHLRVGVKNLKNIFSPSFVLKCSNSFCQRYKATNVFVFLQQSGILYWENKLDKEFSLELKRQQCTSHEPN